MTNTIGGVSRIAALTRYFFRCPPTKHVIIVMLVSALLFPIAGNDIFSKTGFFIFLFVPAILTSIFSWRIVQKLGGTFKENHSYFLSTVSMFAIAALLAFVSFVDNYYAFKIWNSLEILFVGLAAVFILHILVYAAVGSLSLYRAFIPSAGYLFFSAIILYSFRAVTFRILGRFLILVLISFLLVWLFIKLTDAPFKRTLGIATFDLLSFAILEYVAPEQINRNPFKAIGKNVSVPNQAIKFETRKNKYLLAIPWLHPGPVESIGGKLPSALVSKLKKKFSNAVFLHTYVDHSLNPVFLGKSLSKIISLLLNGRKFSGNSSKCTKFINLEFKGVKLLAQKIGNKYFFISTFAPKVTEDIVPAVGLTLLEKFSKNAIFIDAHNSFSLEEDESEAIGFGDKRISNLISAIDLSKKKLDKEKQYSFKFSLINSEKEFLDHGVKGIRILAFEISNQKVAIVVLDTNNLVPEFRENALKKLKSIGFNIAEVVTTDTHLGDFVVKMYGQIGLRGAEILENEIISLAQKSISNLEKARASYSYAEIETKVFGEKTFHQLIATAHSLIPFAKFLGLSLFIAFLFAAYVVLQLQI
ncbi:TPA: DUF2070 family protein [archaeon]|uniref:DUF2070 family protein n=1 Tax=Candidatus Naiadarchaeum limnaeum TaxID=2756139 RepID=A0A832V4N9_9ARCH|nr:DUF2070 family protein [Candidatus Naiadarchaeales archaeon SRR2090153.bin1042]HIK00150.1 DUF2070 family protein [Candidatus Naiadarchaeum limnaeum]